MTCWINGSFVDKDKAVVSVFDHGLLYGDGVFEGIRVYAGRIFKLHAHVQRLYESARSIMLEPPMAHEEMESVISEAVVRDGAMESYVRVVLTRGPGTLGLDPSSCSRPTLIVIVDKVQLYPAELYESGIEIMTSALRRVPTECLDPRIKSLNYLNNVLARADATRSGCHEALMLTTQGNIAECTADNVFIVRGGELLTPHPSAGALDGITMRTVMEVASDHGIKADFATLVPDDLYRADECFLTGTGAEVVPVVKVDGRQVGTGSPGLVTQQITNAYRELVTSDRVGL